MWADAEGRRNVDEEERGSDSKTQRKQAWRATAWEHPHPHPPPSLGSPCSSSWAPPLGDGRDSPPNTCRLAQGRRFPCLLITVCLFPESLLELTDNVLQVHLTFTSPGREDGEGISHFCFIFQQYTVWWEFKGSQGRFKRPHYYLFPIILICERQWT